MTVAVNICIICDVTTVQLSIGTVHTILLNFTFHEKCLFPLRLYLGMLGLRWMCMHYEWTWSRGLLISKKNLKLWKSMYKVNGELSSCDITCSGRVPSREGDNNHFKWPAPTSVCSVMHVKEPTSLKEQGEIRWSGQQSNISYGNGCMMSTPRRGSIFRRLHNSV